MTDKEMFCCAYADYQEIRPDSTFFFDFSIADKFGINAIKDTFNRAFNEWKNDCKMFTELTAVLNHKIWQFYDKDKEIATVYNDIWLKADNYLRNEANFTEEERCYSWHVLD